MFKMDCLIVFVMKISASDLLHTVAQMVLVLIILLIFLRKIM